MIAWGRPKFTVLTIGLGMITIFVINYFVVNPLIAQIF
jgi:hypothetical protein